MPQSASTRPGASPTLPTPTYRAGPQLPFYRRNSDRRTHQHPWAPGVGLSHRGRSRDWPEAAVLGVGPRHLPQPRPFTTS